MKKQLELLEQLQELDIHIYQLETEKYEIPDRIEEEKVNIALLHKRRDAVLAELEVATRERHEKARLIDLDGIRRKNLNNKESQVSNQKEYEMYIKELESLEQEVKEHEVQLRQAEVRMAEIRGRVDALGNEEQGLNNRIAEMEASAEEVVQRIGQELDSKYQSRDRLEDGLEEELLAQYIRISETSDDGIAISYVKNNICLSCYLAVQPQMYNELLTGEKHHQCPNCRRILLYREEVPQWFTDRGK